MPIIGRWLRDDDHLNVFGNWVAPEALLLEEYSVKSDVYSMCCVIWELCYGQVPRTELSLHEIRTLIRDEKIKRLPLEPEVIPAYWKPMLEIGLEIDSSKRDLEIVEIIDMMRLVRQEKPLLNLSTQSNNSSLLKSAPPIAPRSESKDYAVYSCGDQVAQKTEIHMTMSTAV